MQLAASSLDPSRDDLELELLQAQWDAQEAPDQVGTDEYGHPDVPLELCLGPLDEEGFDP